jgi:hypothetical protein
MAAHILHPCIDRPSAHGARTLLCTPAAGSPTRRQGATARRCLVRLCAGHNHSPIIAGATTQINVRRAQRLCRRWGVAFVVATRRHSRLHPLCVCFSLFLSPCVCWGRARFFFNIYKRVIFTWPLYPTRYIPSF